MVAYQNTVIYALWVPVVVFAHLFAFYWLVKTYMLNSAGVASLLKRKKKEKSHRSDGSLSPAGSGGGGGVAGAAPSGKDSMVEVGASHLHHHASAASGKAASLSTTTSKDVEMRVDQDKVEGEEGGEGGSPFANQTRLVVSTGMPHTVSSTDLFSEAEVQQQKALAASMSLAVDPISLEWRGVGCSYNAHGSVKTVLQDVWGKARPGEMQVGVVVCN